MKFTNLKKTRFGWDISTNSLETYKITVYTGKKENEYAYHVDCELYEIHDKEVIRQIDEYIKSELQDKFTKWLEDGYGFEYIKQIGVYKLGIQVLPVELIEDLKKYFVDCIVK